MNAHRVSLVVPAFLLGLSVCYSQEDGQPSGELFNGESLAGWHVRQPMDPRAWRALEAEAQSRLLDEARSLPESGWSVRDGKLAAVSPQWALTSDRAFRDLDLTAELIVVRPAQVTLSLRETPVVVLGSTAAADAHPEVPRVAAELAVGSWHTLRVVQVGEQTEAYLDGQRVLPRVHAANTWNPEVPLAAEGSIQWSVTSGEVHFRSITARTLPADAAHDWLASDEEAFESIFDGQSLAGWEGPTENYQVSDGAIVCLPGKGGTIHTAQEYADFEVRLEFQLPPGGNNGLAIRYPGRGDTAYVGMCELQVIDNDASQYARLDPRQFHGSAYGMVAAHRGYLRPTGHWNYQQVTVRGSTIRVELNGTRILDADLSRVTQFMGNRPHPGVSRTSGHFGLAGHNDPVRFRALRIRRLE